MAHSLFEPFRWYLTTFVLAKAEIAENPEGKEIKNRKVRPCKDGLIARESDPHSDPFVICTAP